MTTDRRRGERREENVVVDKERRDGTDRRAGERRRFARAPIDLWVEEERGNELYFRRTGNVSLGGVYFEQSIPHPLGTRVKLRFSLPGEDDLIEAFGEIVNTPGVKDGLGMGLSFLQIDTAAKKRLADFIDRYQDDEDDGA
jgi:uncharacterized protein (TIGR02266 family)